MDSLKNKFGKRKIKEGQKTRLVQKIFSDVSENYDFMNDLMSFSTHRLWKKRLVEKMNIQMNDTIIDVGSGTNDLAKLILKKKFLGTIYSIDLNLNMLTEAKKNFSKKELRYINFINANAENLPFNNNFFDKYVIAFCLRNITYIEKALNEAFRVLKPGGSFYCLEFNKPTSNLINTIFTKYKKNIIPYLGDKVSNNKNAYRYLEESISQFPQQDILLDNINSAGFRETKYLNMFNGIVCIHTGFKI